MTRDLTKCSICQVNDPIGYRQGRTLTTCEGCYDSKMANRHANRKTKLLAQAAKMKALAR